MIDYAQIPGMNWSRLKSMRMSPLQFYHDYRAAATAAFDAPHFRIGRLAHTLILEPDLVGAHYVCYEGSRRGNGWRDYKADHADKQILTRVEWDKAQGAAHAVLEHPAARRHLVSPIAVEETLTWFDVELNVPCKGRLDVIGRSVVDIKTTAHLHTRLFPTAAARLGYHCQLAYYQDGARANDYAVDDRPVLIAVQSEAPWDVLVYRLPAHVLEAGRAEYRSLLQRYVECTRSGEWPGQAGDELELELPAWAYLPSTDATLTIDGVAIEEW
jgi:hypothetical protein